jgi:anti-sigma factor RsiW
MRMPFWRRRRAMHCREAVGLVTAYLDGALSDVDRDRFEVHLAGCRHCAEYLRQIRVAIQAAGRVEPDDLGDEALDELVTLYRRWSQP